MTPQNPSEVTPESGEIAPESPPPANTASPRTTAADTNIVSAPTVLAPTTLDRTAALSAAPKTATASAPASAALSPDAEAQMRRLSRRSFLWAGVAGIGTIAGYKWIDSRRADQGIAWPLRRVLDAQDELVQDFSSNARLAPTFPRIRNRETRTNGDIGLGEDFDPATWSLTVSGLHSGADLQLSLADIKKFPRTEITTEMKCIEGWAVVVSWAGVRLVDFLKKHPPATQSGEAPDVLKKPGDLLPYAGAQTPDGAYFVGLDMKSVLHPQTLLCYEMNGQPLTLEHGAPLRLVTPTKYGIKHLKRLGTLEFTGQKPQDYWAQQGYDWYAGH